MAFTTQFSYDSPIQVLTCGGSSRVLQPVSKWCRWSQTSFSRSKKAALLFIFGTALYLLMRGNTHSTQQASHRCDSLHPDAHCHAAHGFNSPLQIFLRNSSPEHVTADSHLTDFMQDPAHLPDVNEGRSYKPTMIVQGQYESNRDLGVGYDIFEKTNSTRASGEVTIKDETMPSDEEELQVATEVSRSERQTNLELDPADRQPPIKFLEGELPSTPQHPATGQHWSLPEDGHQEFMREEALPGDEAKLDRLHTHHDNLGQKNYHREQEFVQNEIRHREMLKRRQQEELWQEQRRQQHVPREVPPHPHQSMSGSGMEQWGGPTSQVGVQRRQEFVMDRRHPAWRDSRLPRGVSPRRYYIHPDL